MKQKKRGKICFVIHIAGFFFLKFFYYEVFAKQKKPELADKYYLGAPLGALSHEAKFKQDAKPRSIYSVRTEWVV